MKKFINIFAVLLVLINASSCTKDEVNQFEAKQNYFYKQYSDSTQSENYQYVIAHDKGLSVVGRIYRSYRTTSGITTEKDIYGNTLSTNVFEFDDDVSWHGNEYAPGLYAFSSTGGPEFMLRNRDGSYTEPRKMDFESVKNLDLFLTSPLARDENGLFYTVVNDAYATPRLDSINRFIVAFDEFGKESFAVSVPDSVLVNKGICIRLYVNKVKNNKVFMSGYGTRAPFMSASYIKNYVTVYDMETKEFTTTTFGPNDVTGEFMIDRIAPEGTGWVTLCHSWDWNWGNNSKAANPNFVVRNIAEDGSVTWEKEINIESVRLLPTSIEECPQGYLVGGFLIRSGTDHTVPYFVILDKQGNVLTKKIMYNLPNVWVYQMVMDKNGDIVICGNHGGFGRGKEGNSPILVKCDLEGNYTDQ